jgi:hypothetical protein
MRSRDQETPRTGFTLRFLFFSKLPPEQVHSYLCVRRIPAVEQKEGFARALLSLGGT